MVVPFGCAQDRCREQVKPALAVVYPPGTSAVDHVTNTVLAYVFGKRMGVVFQDLKALLAPFNISRYFTDRWGAYERHLDVARHEVGKQDTQKIECKNLNFRTWFKRLARRSICFSKLERMHDVVIGLLINKVEFGRDIHS